MQHGHITRSIIRQPDPRYVIDLPAELVVMEGEPLPVRLINLSRNGFRIASDRVFPAGQPVRIEVGGWPRLAGRVIWCDRGRIGCVFDQTPSDSVFDMMRAATLGSDRDEF